VAPDPVSRFDPAGGAERKLWADFLRSEHVDWVQAFYSKTGEWWGRAEGVVQEQDHHRLDLLHQVRGPGPLRVLDLGCGYGITAWLAASLGHHAVGVDLSDRLDFQRPAPDNQGAGSLRLVKADF
jgi:SAM-dependent methyltransferase